MKITDQEVLERAAKNLELRNRSYYVANYLQTESDRGNPIDGDLVIEANEAYSAIGEANATQD